MIRWADRIVVLAERRVVGEGTHDELLGRCAAYRTLVAPQVDAIEGAGD
jgi:ATP-binding cassette, subfamily B, bacterial